MGWEPLRDEDEWVMDPRVASIYWDEIGRNRNVARKTIAKMDMGIVYKAVADETGHRFQVVNSETKERKTMTKLERRKISQRNQTDQTTIFTCSKCDYTNLIEPGKYKYCRRCRRVRDAKRSK